MKEQTEKLTDAQLSQKLGRYQRMESIGMLLGILCVVVGCILMFVKRDVILISVLVFVGVALFLLVAKPAQTKKKALLQQLGDYFRRELTRVFGIEPEMPSLPIDCTFLKEAKLTAVPWSECSINAFHEGECAGLRFSAANVELRRTVEERSGPQNDNWMTRSETLFRGIVVRCKDICAPALDIAVQEQFQERKKDDITEPAAFRRHFAARTADGQSADDRVTPQLRRLVQQLEAFANNGKVCCLSLHGGSLTLALNTGYVFADIPDSVDMRDIDGIRKWYTASLTGMERLLTLLRESPALSGAGTEE